MLVLAMQFSRNECRDASGRPPRGEGRLHVG